MDTKSWFKLLIWGSLLDYRDDELNRVMAFEELLEEIIFAPRPEEQE